MRVLIITSQWPTPESPEKVPFLFQQVQYLRRSGVDISVFAFRGHKNPANYFLAWLKLRRQFDLSRFDLIHAHFGPSGLLALPHRCPLVVTFHGTDLQGIVRENGRYGRLNVVNILSRLIARFADERIVVANHLRQYLPATVDVNVIPGGVDLHLFQPLPQAEARHQLGLPEEGQIVLFAADPRRAVKRFSLAEQAVSLLPEHCRPRLLTTADVPHNLMPVYMNACDVLLLTSRHEGSPTVVKEALACNLPVVSLDVGDVHQQVSGIPGCIICVNDSPQTIATALAEVLQFPTQVSGRERMRQLDEQLVAQKIIALYERATQRFIKSDLPGRLVWLKRSS